MVQITDKTKCCGCTACSNICPSEAITMVKDGEGFAYPAINSDTCTGCGICETVCPYRNTDRPTADLKQTFAAVNRNEEQRSKSSSGGMFVLLANEILSHGGVVFGAGYGADWCAVHKCATDPAALEDLIGSKYMQSELGDTFTQIERLLESGKTVLMVGTTCQIDGLKNYLAREYTNLYCVDFICLGVPSSQIWKDYLTTFYDKEKITYINFKDKSRGWHTFSLDIEYEKQKHTVEGRNALFFRGYFDHLYTRPSCSNCVSKKGNRCSDITISDCWGYKHIAPEMDDNKGMSSVICHTEKGLALFESVQKQLIWKKGRFEDVIKYNPGYFASSPPGQEREAFWRDYDIMDKKELFKKYCTPKKKLFAKRVWQKIKSYYGVGGSA